MWILTPLQPGGETHYLLSSKEYVVGRKNCDVLLPNDQSISRVHAHLTATDRTLTVKDTSKYGTFINGQRVTESTPSDLNSGDSLTFGVFHSKFSVEHMQLVVCSSCLDNDGKTSLSQAVLHMGGQLVNTWTENCTHLVMPTVKVTVKTICALLCCRPIVKPEFFPALHTAVQQNSPPPKAEMFVPEIDEPSLNKEDVNVGAVSKRKELFRGKTFIFLNAKQLKRLSAAVGFGGGRCNLLKEGSLPRELLESAQSCVVDITTVSSQTLLSPSATEWVNSVRNIVERKGLRVITESEIGLAAIYASCEKHCNTSLPDHESVPKVKPRIPSASLSQSVAVDETVLPAASQNITAYAVNTEPSQGLDKVSGVTAVGETPEKGLNQKTKELSASRPGAKKKLDTQYFVAESLNLSYNTMEPTVSQRKTDESKRTGGNSGGFRSQPSFLKPTGSTKTFFQKYSPQKQTPSTQASPHKQSSLTNFFRPVNKKRPLEEGIPAETSEPKRPVCDYSINTVTFEETPTRLGKGSRDKSQTSQGLADDPFAPQPNVSLDKLSFTAQKKPHSEKRKEMEEDIDLDELESLMSEDMDCFDDPPSRNKSQSQVVDISNQQDQVCNVESSNKRQRLHKPDSERGKRREKTSSKEVKEQNVCMTIDTFQPSENRTDDNKSSKPAARPSADKKQNILPLEEGEHYSVEGLVSGVPKKTVTIKEEVQKSKIKDDLPKKLLLVEFRDLTVTEPSKRVSQPKQSNGYTKNFKGFRKVQILDSAHVIRGTHLFAHNRGKNSDLDEWLKDAAEEELQSRRDESAGDDLFRYNPTKLAKRR